MLEVARVTTTYRGMIAISDVSLSVGTGEIVTVVGANGAGKSTLLKTIAGMEHCQAGQITFEGERIDAMPAHGVTARGIAFVPENRRLFPRLSVRDNLRLGSFLHRGKPDREAPLGGIFDLFPVLRARLDQMAATLSGGEQQMLAIGRALMTRPKLLMLDEPSQGIMPKLVDLLFDAIKAIRASGVTILLVEQRLAESLAIADNAVVLQTGRVVLRGRSEELRDHPEMRSAYLGL
ncbi:MAG: ABC transporter ATP-binding protein [Acetobacteraceae bacterium]|nr:ABC transporter ATP-binding protein [Acetobacteraceae bacterium]